jgi:hypothetical protein
MTPKELAEIDKFKNSHYNSRCYTKNGTDAIKFKITIKATGIGESVKIKCCGCKEKLDVTDIDSW